MIHTALVKKFAIYLLILYIKLALTQMAYSKDSSEWLNNNWSFRQEMNISIDTTEDEAKFQEEILQILHLKTQLIDK